MLADASAATFDAHAPDLLVLADAAAATLDAPALALVKRQKK